MSEFSLPPNTTKANFLSLLLSDFFFFFCSFIISHPLYFSYFIFFSPYIIKILSFLSPLFITTSLLLLSLFTTFLRSNNNNNAGDANYGQPQLLVFEDLEAYYKIVFDTSSSFENIQEDEVSEEEEKEKEGLISTSEAPVDKHMCHESNQLIVEGDKEVKPLRVDELKKVEETSNKAMEKVRVESQRFGAGEDDDDVDEHLWSNEKDVGLCKTQSFGSSLGSYGSMRKEKEWRRTLACKLFEERHNNNNNNNNNNNVEGSDEGMDMLWETYETDSNKKQKQKQQKQQQQLAKSKTKKGNKWSKYKHHDDDGDGDEEEEIDDDDDDDDDGKLCCLQALKFSAGKMNLGMGRPNLVKFSKAFKGIGWLHSMTKHGKKIYH